jgi:hypothetical protein
MLHNLANEHMSSTSSTSGYSHHPRGEVLDFPFFERLYFIYIYLEFLSTPTKKIVHFDDPAVRDDRTSVLSDRNSFSACHHMCVCVRTSTHRQIQHDQPVAGQHTARRLRTQPWCTLASTTCPAWAALAAFACVRLSLSLSDDLELELDASCSASLTHLSVCACACAELALYASDIRGREHLPDAGDSINGNHQQRGGGVVYLNLVPAAHGGLQRHWSNLDSYKLHFHLLAHAATDIQQSVSPGL